MTATNSVGSLAQDRFEFGENWRRFLAFLDDERIAQAQESLTIMLGVTTLEGKRILDAGSGSGLFSLAAHRLGAEVHSFDFDHSSVACTMELRRRYGDGSRWTVERGDVLDEHYLAGLGQFDVVYSWGVLHHTGDMWAALKNVVDLVRPGGILCLAIYNDQGRRSRMWRALKRRYNRLPAWLRTPYALTLVLPVEFARAVFHTIRGQPGFYLRS